MLSSINVFLLLQLVTKYYHYGSLNLLDDILRNVTALHGFQIRSNLAIDYVSVLGYLHNSPLGVRVMCDSNDLLKALTQYLITDELRLVVNDLDALPEVDAENGKYAKCGHRQLFGGFVAPEQLWPHEDVEFSDDAMRGYNEKTDVWKTPDVLTFILGSSTYANQVKFRLFDLFRRCKDIEPSLRPSMTEIRSELIKTVELILSRNEL